MNAMLLWYKEVLALVVIGYLVYRACGAASGNSLMCFTSGALL